jgi:hypothetical protein
MRKNHSEFAEFCESSLNQIQTIWKHLLAKLAAIIPLRGGTPIANLAKNWTLLAEERRLMIGNYLAILAKTHHYRQNRHLNFTQYSALTFTAAIAAAVFIPPPPPQTRIRLG